MKNQVYSDDGIIHVVLYWLGTYVWTHDSYACVPDDWITKWRGESKWKRYVEWMGVSNDRWR